MERESALGSLQHPPNLVKLSLLILGGTEGALLIVTDIYQPSDEFERLYRQGQISLEDYKFVTSFTKDGWVPRTIEEHIIKKARSR